MFSLVFKWLSDSLSSWISFNTDFSITNSITLISITLREVCAFDSVERLSHKLSSLSLPLSPQSVFGERQSVGVHGTCPLSRPCQPGTAQLRAVCLLPAVCFLSPTACCLLPAACCLLPAAACCLPPAADVPPPVTPRLLRSIPSRRAWLRHLGPAASSWQRRPTHWLWFPNLTGPSRSPSDSAGR